MRVRYFVCERRRLRVVYIDREGIEREMVIEKMQACV
jgi:hypothetical protein